MLPPSTVVETRVNHWVAPNGMQIPEIDGRKIMAEKWWVSILFAFLHGGGHQLEHNFVAKFLMIYILHDILFLANHRPPSIQLSQISHEAPKEPLSCHDDVIKWKHFMSYWPFVRGIHRSPGNYPHKGQYRGALIFPLICGWTNGWVNNRDANTQRLLRAHYDVTVM